VNATRVVTGILAAAALIFAFLWWRAPGDEATSPEGAGDSTRLDLPPNYGGAPSPADASQATAPVTTPVGVVPVAAMVRAELAADFRGLRLPERVIAALVEGRLEDAVRQLEEATDGDATVALVKLPGFCAGTIGSSTLDPRDLRRYATGDVSPDAAAALERTVSQQRDWGLRVVQGCEQAGLLRSGPPAAQARAAERSVRIAARLQRCANDGHAGCLAQLATREGVDPKRRTTLLQSAAILGSAEAQALLLYDIERSPRAATPEAREAARYWRESLARNDPEYRAVLLGCYDDGCDPRKLDRASVRAQLESAMRDGSVTALSHLMTSERTAAEHVASDGGAVDVAQLAVVNPSETDAYAWKSVAERLAWQGCLGLWPTWAPFVGAAAAAERALRPSQLDDARRLADAHWQANGRAFAARRGCAHR
jgi:hypothetical protein